VRERETDRERQTFVEGIYTSVALLCLLFTLLSATFAAFLSVMCKSFWLRATRHRSRRDIVRYWWLSRSRFRYRNFYHCWL